MEDFQERETMSNEYIDWMNEGGPCGDCIHCKGTKCELGRTYFKVEICEHFLRQDEDLFALSEKEKILVIKSLEEKVRELTLKLESFHYNINDDVLVKITPRGRDVVDMKNNEYTKRWGVRALYTLPIPDSDGYSKFQLWELMNLFGDYIGTGYEVPFETNIILKGEA